MRAATSALCFVSAVLLSVLSIPASADDSANLAPNPGFELTDGQEPAFWAQRTPTDHQRTLVWDTQVARSGKRSLKIHNRPSAGLSRWRYGHLHDFAMKPGSEGELTVWAKCEAAKGSAQTKLYFMDAAGHILAQPQSSGINGTRDWTPIRLPFEVPEKTAYVMIYLELNGEGMAWFDDVALTGVPTKPSADVAVDRLTCNAEDFEHIEGFVPKLHRRLPTVELPPGVSEGHVEIAFRSDSARYDVSVNCPDRPNAGSRLALFVNGKQVAAWSLAETTDAGRGIRNKVVSDVDIQRGSRVVLQAQSQNGRCRVRQISFAPVGRFQGRAATQRSAFRGTVAAGLRDFSRATECKGHALGFHQPTHC